MQFYILLKFLLISYNDKSFNKKYFVLLDLPNIFYFSTVSYCFFKSKYSTNFKILEISTLIFAQFLFWLNNFHGISGIWTTLSGTIFYSQFYEKNICNYNKFLVFSFFITCSYLDLIVIYDKKIPLHIIAFLTGALFRKAYLKITNFKQN